MKRKIRYDRIAGVFFVLFWVWVLASFIDVNLHNQPFSAGYQHFADWNLFIWAFNVIFPR